MSNNADREDYFRLESLRIACNMATASTGILENAEKYYEWLLNEPKIKKNTRKTSSK